MDIVILSIGSELLKGRTVNTNAAYMAARLYAAGFNVVAEHTVADGERLILKAFEHCFAEADFVIATGGLGPTRDDITKAAACKFFGLELEFDKKYYERLEKYFKTVGYTGVPQRSYGQAEVPKGAEVLPNSQGTAPGLWISGGKRTLVLLPGVPREMEYLIDEQVLPRMAGRYAAGSPHSAVVRTVGVGESTIAEQIEQGLSPEEQELLNYYPHGGFVDIVVAAAGDVKPVSEATVKKVAAHVARVMDRSVYTTDERDIWQVIGDMLQERRHRLAVAESCTGGLLAETITSTPGASAWFAGGAVTYSNDSKTSVLGVPAVLIDTYGAVSDESAMAMARGAGISFGAHWTLAITGIAGPGGGSDEKPVGTVFIALSGPVAEKCDKFSFNGNRAQVRHRSAVKATELLWRALRDSNPG
jgi:nicotinamide-nucleotide amidase